MRLTMRAGLHATPLVVEESVEVTVEEAETYHPG
jgi:NOL1/NOP2/fmu family ribosome biogenesis protein